MLRDTSLHLQLSGHARRGQNCVAPAKTRSSSEEQLSWREAHNKMLLRRFIALENLKKTQPPIDEDQKLALLHAPFTGEESWLNYKRQTLNVECRHSVPANSTPCLLSPTVCRSKEKF